MRTIIRLFNTLSLLYFRTPAAFRWIYWVAVLVYFISPIDLVPDVIPGLGKMDDILVVLTLIWVYDRFKNLRPFFKQAKGGQQQSTDTRGRTTTQNPYEVLGVKRDATKDEIKKAYRQLVGRYHPDKFAHLGQEFEDTARQKTEEIIKAYEALR